MQRIRPGNDYWYIKWYQIGKNEKIVRVKQKPFLKHPDGSNEEVIACKVKGYYLKKVPVGSLLIDEGKKHLVNNVFVYKRKIALSKFTQLFENTQEQNEIFKLNEGDELFYANVKNSVNKLLPIHYIITKEGHIKTAYPNYVTTNMYKGIKIPEEISHRAEERRNEQTQVKAGAKKRPLEYEAIPNKKPKTTGSYSSDEESHRLNFNISPDSSSTIKDDQSSDVSIDISDEERTKLLENLNRYIAFLRTQFKQKITLGDSVDSILNEIYNTNTYKHVRSECQKYNFEFQINQSENNPSAYIKDLDTNKEVTIVLWEPRLNVDLNNTTEVQDHSSKQSTSNMQKKVNSTVDMETDEVNLLEMDLEEYKLLRPIDELDSTYEGSLFDDQTKSQSPLLHYTFTQEMNKQTKEEAKKKDDKPDSESTNKKPNTP